MSRKRRRYHLHWPTDRPVFAPWLPDLPNPLPVVSGQWLYRWDLDEDRLPPGLRGRMRLAIHRHQAQARRPMNVLPLGIDHIPAGCRLERLA